jgi:O-antigen/teichoic acid export membrane protein
VEGPLNPSPPDADSTVPEESPSALLSRGLAATRILLVRGFVLRIISFSTNLVLIALITPVDFGMLAVVRGTFSLVEFASELGFQMALIRRSETPTSAQLAGLSGFRTLVFAGTFLLAVAWPSARTVFGLLPQDLGVWMLMALGVLLVTPTQSASKILLERDLQFTRLSVIEVTGVLLQNVGLIAFAYAGRFGEGMFCVQATQLVYYTLALQRARRAPRLSFDLRPLLALLGESASFSLAALVSVLRESLTSILVARLFGLSTAGIWAFAVRARQFLQLTIEAYGRAGMAVAGRLRTEPALFRQFARTVLGEAAGIMYPVAAIAYAVLPLVGVWFPHWAPAVPVTQTYIVLFALLAVVQVSLWPVAVARVGPRALLVSESLALVVAWAGLAVVRVVNGGNIALPLAGGLAASVVYLLMSMPSGDRPPLRPALQVPLMVLALSLLLTEVASSLRGGPLVHALLASSLPAVVLTVTLARRRAWPIAGTDPVQASAGEVPSP